jgi:hypothetical protein
MGNNIVLKNRNFLFSVFLRMGFAVKVVVLFILTSVYFIIGGFAVILYLVFYEKLFKTLLMSLDNKKQKSPYYYKWKKHHLELSYEA